jgi:hypothetical protein
MWQKTLCIVFLITLRVTTKTQRIGINAVTEDPLEEKKRRLYNLTPTQRFIIALAILAALILDKPYLNFIVGGVAGVLLYPMLEYFIYVTYGTFNDDK